MKLKLSTSSAQPPAPSELSASTPTPGGGIKIKFKTSLAAGSPPPSALTAPATSTPKLKISKPKSDAASKKRPRDDDGESSTKPKKPATTATIRLGANKSSLIGKSISLKTRTDSVSTLPSATRVKIKVKGKIPPRPLGVGYDSEAEGAEEDPATEEHFVLRMMPGEDCDYLRKAIEERKIGVPVREGGAEVGMRFFRSDGRRAVVNIKGTYYAAALVDLPCIVETMKSWDKRGWWKSADICQMLYVFRKVKQEDDARHCSLPAEVNEKTWLWPHGLTPPMYNVRKRRFRKRVGHRTIEACEAEVERLLEQDRKCTDMGGTVEDVIVDPRQEEPENEEVEYDDEQDAEGEPDEEGADQTDLFASLAEMLDREETAPEISTVDQTTIAAAPDVPTPTVEAEVMEALEETMVTDIEATGITEGEDEEEEESDEDEDDEDAEDDEEDDDARAKVQELAQQREEVEYLEKELAMQREAYTKQANPLLKRRLADKLKNLEADLQIKKRALGITDDDA